MKKFLPFIAGIFSLTLVLACNKKTATDDWLARRKADPVSAMEFPDQKPSSKEKAAEAEKKKVKDLEKDKDADLVEDLSKPLDRLPDARVSKMITISDDNVTLYKGPGTKFKSAGTANRNDTFLLLQTVRSEERGDTWYKVRDQQGNKFFVSGRQANIKHVREQIKHGQKVTLEKIQTIFDPTPPLPPELVQAKTITLNFENTDIFDVITTFCELLKLDYVIEGAVQGKVTLQTFNNIAVGELYSVLEQILAVNHMTVVKSGNFYRFLPVSDAIKKPVSIHFGENANIPPNERLIIEIIPLKHVSVESMKKIIQPLLTKDATFLDVPETNNLMMVELASNVKRIIRVVQALDIDKLSRSDVHLYRIEHTDASVLAKELSEIFSSIGYKDVVGDSLNFLTIDRLNAILVVNAFEDLTPTIEFWIEKLDQPVMMMGAARMATFVYYVQNGEAGVLAGLIKQVFAKTLTPQLAQKRPGAPGAKPGAPGSTPAPGGVPGAAASPAPAATGLGLGGAGATMGSPGPTMTGVGTAVFGGADLSTLGQPRSSVTTPSGAKVSIPGAIDQDFEGDLITFPDKDTNSIIIRTSPRNYPAILELLKKLDLLPQQVLIEVLIIDVTLDDTVQTSISGVLLDKGNLEKNQITTSIGSVQTPTTTLGSTFGTAAASFAPTFSVVLGQRDKFLALLQTLATQSKANILANPILVSSNNKPANIAITQEVPIVTSTIGLGTQTTATQQIQYRSVGTILNIDPKINRDNFVNLKVAQEISELGNQIAGQPSFNTRKLMTDVVLKDNQSLVMGGLMRTRTADSTTGIPFLKDIPLLGRLFGSHENIVQKSELMLFITPHVINNVPDTQYVTDQMKIRLSEVKTQQREKYELEPAKDEEKKEDEKSGSENGKHSKADEPPLDEIPLGKETPLLRKERVDPFLPRSTTVSP